MIRLGGGRNRRCRYAESGGEVSKFEVPKIVRWEFDAMLYFTIALVFVCILTHDQCLPKENLLLRSSNHTHTAVYECQSTLEVVMLGQLAEELDSN